MCDTEGKKAKQRDSINVYVGARFCVHGSVRIRGCAAVGVLLLMAALCSLSLSLCTDQFMGLLYFSAHTTAKFMSLDTSLSHGIN